MEGREEGCIFAIMKNVFDSKTVTFQELLGNGKKYKVPEFQRDFSWGQDNWEDLWNDMKDVYEGREAQHYMGAIVLQNMPQVNKTFLLVDGQQRMTTLSLFILALVKVLKELVARGIEPEDNQQRIDKILNSYIGEKSIARLYYEPKLELNENNNSFYQTRMLEFKEPLHLGKLRDSERLIYEAYLYFYRQINSYFSDLSGESLGVFLEYVLDRLVFVQIAVDDDVSAYTVFETLNARGVELTTTDLLKNYLFALVAKLGKDGSEFKILKEDWQEIVDMVGLKRFPVFLRFYLNSRQELVRKERLFKEIKKDVRDAKGAVELIESLKDAAYFYAALLNPEDDFWSEYKDAVSIRESLRALSLFGVTQPQPLLFAINRKEKSWLSKALKWLVAVSFRYHVIGELAANAVEKVYNEIAVKIERGEINSLSQIREGLRPVYMSDEDFVNAFKTKSISTGGRNRRLVKYILTKIENQLAGKGYHYTDATFTIEHILPEHYGENWNEFFAGSSEKYVHRLGNYTLLEVGKNREAGDKPFEDKKALYQASQFKLAQDLLRYEEWNIAALNQRQEQMAKWAKAIWKM